MLYEVKLQIDIFQIATMMPLPMRTTPLSTPTMKNEQQRTTRLTSVVVLHMYTHVNSCSSPPCHGDNTQSIRTKWPTGLHAKFFDEHPAEVQVRDIFFTVLNPHVPFFPAAATDASNSVVLDIGSNAGYFR